MATTVTRQDSPFHTQKLSNGLQMIGQRIPGVQSAAIVFWVCTGTRDETPEEMGVSHFLEHMAFRRTPHFAGKEIDRAFEEMGADHNAATWLEMTFYWARVLSENLTPAVRLLSDLTRPVLDADDFNQERPVILEEIARSDDQPAHVLIDHFMYDFFGDHPLSRETLGTPQTIKALTVEQMRAYWARRYGTENMIFAIAGSFDWERLVEEVESLTADWPRGESGRSLSRAPFLPGVHVYPRETFVQEQIAIGTPTVSRKDPRYYTASVLAVILGDDSGSRLFWALNHTGLAETAVAQVWDFDDNGLLLVHISTESGVAGEALRVARAEMRRLQDFDVQEDELERAKAKLNSSVIIGGESTNERVMRLIDSWLTIGRPESLAEIRAKIEAVTLDDLRQLVLEYPLWPDQVVSAVGPLSREELDPSPSSSHAVPTFGAYDTR